MKNVYFISDLHLGANYLNPPREFEDRVVKFLYSIKDDASHLYLLGDILDYWFEYKTVVPRGYVRFFGALAALADSGVKITWIVGNHDIWLFDYLKNEIGMDVVDGEVVTEFAGKRFYLAHGDALGGLKPGFKFIRAIFRNKFCQWLYAQLPPCWTVPFAHAWSGHSRETGKKYEVIDPETDNYVQFAYQYNKNNPFVDYFIFGHRHVIFDYNPENMKNSSVIILGDWISHFSYAIFDGKCLKMDKFSAEN
ncbi:MAG: UDP-2,3-diacylglucosamine diphosphatase [Muribaculaceae bacterium]